MRKPINHLFCSCSSGLFAAIPLTLSLSLVKKWYFITKIVLTYCEKKNVLMIEKNF